MSIARGRLSWGMRTLWRSSRKAPKLFSFDRYGACRPQPALESTCSQRSLRISAPLLLADHSPVQCLQPRTPFPISASQALAEGEARDSVAKSESIAGYCKLLQAIKCGVMRSMKARFAAKPSKGDK